MTNQEVIRLIRNLPTMCEFTDAYGDPIDSDAYYEAVDMAISALQEQEAKHSTEGSEELKQEAKNSSDLISRQALCEYAMNQKDKSVTPNDIMRFPPAQPEHLVKESRTLVKDLVKDTISRQAVLETVRTMHKRCDTGSVEDYRDLLVACFKNLPSAQSEIVRCKDCKHHWTHRCMDSMPTEICELGQTFYDANVDFCSLAERRTDE